MSGAALSPAPGLLRRIWLKLDAALEVWSQQCLEAWGVDDIDDPEALAWAMAYGL